MKKKFIDLKLATFINKKTGQRTIALPSKKFIKALPREIRLKFPKKYLK